MGKKILQEQQMKNYFVDATKEILKGEGLKSVSVRNIAEKAGYSYATLYNYFTDAKDLIFYCVKDFQQECENYINDNIKGIDPGLKRIKAIFKYYINYLTEYPGIFELFYLEKTPEIASKKPTLELINNFTDRLCADDWYDVVSNGLISKNDAQIKIDLLKNTITGLLVNYLNRYSPADYRQFNELVESQLNYILNPNYALRVQQIDA